MHTRIDLDSFPSENRDDVVRAANLLEEQMTEIRDFRIEAHWRYGTDGGGKPVATLDLRSLENGDSFAMVNNSYPLHMLSESDPELRRRFALQIWYFTRKLSEYNRSDLKSLRKELAEMIPVGGE